MEKTALVVECKWSVNPIGPGTLADLKKKAHVLIRDYKMQKVQYVLFYRSRFTLELEEQVKTVGVGLYTVEQLVNSD